MVRQRFDKLREPDDGRLVVTTMKLMEERVALRPGLEEARERKGRTNTLFLLRSDDYTR